MPAGVRHQCRLPCRHDLHVGHQRRLPRLRRGDAGVRGRDSGRLTIPGQDGGALTGVSKTPFVTIAPPLPVKVAENVPVAFGPPMPPPFVMVTLQACLVPVWTKSTEKVPGVPIGPPSAVPPV